MNSQQVPPARVSPRRRIAREGVAAGDLKEEAVKFGISAKSIDRLTKERDDYVKIVNSPTSVIAVRAALTKGIPSALRLVQGRMNQLDGLILQFDQTAEGRKLIAAWKATRIIRDLGRGKREDAPATPDSGPAAA